MSIRASSKEFTAGRAGLGALVGRGYTSDIYSWQEGRVVKLFHPRVQAAKVERELRVTRAVHAAGLPAPEAHELVEIEGRLGIILERLDGPAMPQVLERRPWTLFQATRQLAELHARLHQFGGPIELPSQRKWIGDAIDGSTILSATHRDTARCRLEALPSGNAVCHGDFHPGNIVLTVRGPVVIDWGSATLGHPLGDVALTSRLFRIAKLPPWMPWHLHVLVGCSRTLLRRTYLSRYLQLQPGTHAQIEAWRVPIDAIAEDRLKACEQT